MKKNLLLEDNCISLISNLFNFVFHSFCGVGGSWMILRTGIKQKKSQKMSFSHLFPLKTNLELFVFHFSFSSFPPFFIPLFLLFLFFPSFFPLSSWKKYQNAKNWSTNDKIDVKSGTLLDLAYQRFNFLMRTQANSVTQNNNRTRIIQSFSKP